MERLKSNLRELIDDTDANNVEMLDVTGVVLKFQESVPKETVEWICHLIQKPFTSSGAGLQVKEFETDSAESSSKYFIITANFEQLLFAAERHRLLKLTHDGCWTPFVNENRHDFQNYEDGSQDFFTPSEKQFLLKQTLDNVVSHNNDLQTVPNFPLVKIYQNRPILPRCIASGVLQIYPLHDNDSMKSLKRKWYVNYSTLHQPIEDIKSYFGEVIALYFSFLGFYTKFLIPPAVIGLLHWCVYPDENKADNVWFAILNVIWSTVFLEIWKRKSTTIVFGWGRLVNAEDPNILLESPRAEYQGNPRVSPITGLLEPYYPTWRRQVKMYFVSYPVLILSLCIAMCGMWLYFEFHQQLMIAQEHSTGLWAALVKKMPGVVYATFIYCLNTIYRKVAVYLNDWENHRLQSSYNNHLIIKLVCFYFVNSFLLLFYIAFYLRDMALLRQQLATQLVIQQFIQQVQESVLPYISYKKNIIQVKKQGKAIRVTKIRDPTNQVVKEGNMPLYSDTFYDYLEMFIQFGYVFMFSAAYPLAAFWALVNNGIELRTDAFKLCKLHQRPFTQPVKSIGVWQNAFELMSIIAVMTNCGLIALSKSTQTWLDMKSDPVKYVLILVAVEHVIIIAKLFIAKMIPDIPGRINKLLAKAQYKTEKNIKEKMFYHFHSQRRPTENYEEL